MPIISYNVEGRCLVLSGMCHDILVDLPSARAMVRGKHNPKITFCSVLAVWRENLSKLGPNRSRHLSQGEGGGMVLLRISHVCAIPKGMAFWPSENGYTLCPVLYLSFQFQMNKNETEEYANSTAFKEFFVCALI